MTEPEIDEQVQDFVTHRAEIKKPMTPVAVKRLKQRAMRMNARGVDVVEAFDKAITSGWQSIYEPKADHRRHAEYVPDTSPAWNRETGRAAVRDALRLVKWQ